MRSILLFVIFLLAVGATDLSKVKWIHGSGDCAVNTDPLIQVVQYDESTWIMRQNKCIHYEAPFLFLFLGKEKALLVDTGATADENTFPLYATVREILSKAGKNGGPVELVVAHTHSHDDHWLGDVQFRGRSQTKVVGLQVEDVERFFGLKNWPLQSEKFNLGSRRVEIIPIPGHDKTSIALYDYQTKLLLTGDTFYPGRLYVRDWDAFRGSVKRLVTFTATHAVSHVLGNHIEMSNAPGVDYPTGTLFQPNEPPLPLAVAELQQLNDFLNVTPKPERKVFDKFIVSPK